MKLVSALGKDAEQAYQQQRGQYLDGIMRAAQNAGSYSAAISMLYAQDLDMKERNTLEGQIAEYYHVNRGTGKPSGGGRGSGSLTEKEARAAYNKLQILSINLSNGEDIKPDEFIAARDAGNIVDDYNILSDEQLQELRSLYNDQHTMSDLTKVIEKRGLAGAYKDLVVDGTDSIVAGVLVTKAENYYLKDDFQGEIGNGT